MENQNKNQKLVNDRFTWLFYYLVPISIPIIVFLGTWIFYPFVEQQFRWIPLIIIYWTTLWTYITIFHYKRGGIFDKERFKITLKFKGSKLGWQYLLVYGPICYNIPIFIVLYANHMSLLMYLVVAIASVINGLSEEIYWRATLDEVGNQLGKPESKRLIYEPIIFSLWHIAFMIHLYPHDNTFFVSVLGILLMTWSSGLIWLWAMLKSKRIFPQCVVHCLANFFGIFPMLLITVIQFSF